MLFLERLFKKNKDRENKESKVEVIKKPPIDKNVNVENGAIITIAREFGSGGREVALKVAEKLNYRFYDKESIVNVAKENGIDTELFSQVDEKNMDDFWFKVSPLAYDIQEETDSFEQKVSNDKMFMIQSDTIRKLAENGGVVFVGRCASYILKNKAKKVFVVADINDRIARVKKRYNLSDNEAKKLIEVADKKREKYYDYYTNSKWNDVKNYDLIINVSENGIDKAVEKIVSLIKA